VPRKFTSFSDFYPVYLDDLGCSDQKASRLKSSPEGRSPSFLSLKDEGHAVVLASNGEG